MTTTPTTAPTVVVIGTADTKGAELDFVRDRLREHGVGVVLVDAGILGEPSARPDVTRQEVAAAAGGDVAELAAAGDRGEAVRVMAEGAAAVARRLHRDGRLHGLLGIGGSGNTSLVTHAMRALPIGVPKLMVSTVASGDVREYVGSVDLAMMYSVVDIAGVNRVSARILANAAGMLAGAVTARVPDLGAERPVIGATMFGVTTPCVTAARELLEARGYELLVFHATGTGGQSMEGLARDGYLAGVLDVTTTELADELAGGVFSAGPDRLEAAGRIGLPQVVSLGALDMVNFLGPATVPERYRSRRLHAHNPSITLMRTTPEENAELGRRIAAKLSAATGPTALFVPLRGVSAVAVAGGVFHDPAADEALFAAIRDHLAPAVELHELDTDINDPAFAAAMAGRLDELISDRAAAAARAGGREEGR
jgi:uncharacterized protein (UPF0261 family)